MPCAPHRSPRRRRPRSRRRGRFYERLGFQVGARNRHPWGTENRMIQFRSSFIELITLGEGAASRRTDATLQLRRLRSRLPVAARRPGDAGARQRAREGGRGAFRRARGIGAFEPFFFERTGRGRTAARSQVAFTLAFARDPRRRWPGFFVCQHHFPENFWNPAFQVHPNGARRARRGCPRRRPSRSAHRAFLDGLHGRRAHRARRATICPSRSPAGISTS